MPIDDPRERLLTASAQGRARTVRGGPPRPGDLYVLKATTDLPVEWALLDQRPDGRILAVPADTNPLAGGADVEVPAAAPGGPLTLRCRFGAWLDAALFEPGLRSGSLAPETVAEARKRVQQIENGTLEPSPLAEEVDADSEYKDWIRETPEEARALVLAARLAVSREPQPGFWEWYRLAAAVLTLVAVGLTACVVVLRREVDQLQFSAPIFDISTHDLVLGEKTRGPSDLEILPQASHILLTLAVDPTVSAQVGRFEILDTAGHVVWRSRTVRLSPDNEFRLLVPRSLLPDGRYSIRIVSEAGQSLTERALRIKTLGDERKLGDGSERN